MAARTGARNGLSPPALASDSSALDHSATEGTIMTWDQIFHTRCTAVARRGKAGFVSLSALVSDIFKETGWGRPPPQQGAG